MEEEEYGDFDSKRPSPRKSPEIMELCPDGTYRKPQPMLLSKDGKLLPIHLWYLHGGYRKEIDAADEELMRKRMRERYEKEEDPRMQSTGYLGDRDQSVSPILISQMPPQVWPPDVPLRVLPPLSQVSSPSESPQPKKDLSPPPQVSSPSESPQPKKDLSPSPQVSSPSESPQPKKEIPPPPPQVSPLSESRQPKKEIPSLTQRTVKPKVLKPGIWRRQLSQSLDDMKTMMDQKSTVNEIEHERLQVKMLKYQIKNLKLAKKRKWQEVAENMQAVLNEIAKSKSCQD